MREEQMHMILGRADDEGLAIKIREDSAEVTMNLFAKQVVFQKWPPFLGREDHV
jgi:hypothetical protein